MGKKNKIGPHFIYWAGDIATPDHVTGADIIRHMLLVRHRPGPQDSGTYGCEVQEQVAEAPPLQVVGECRWWVSAGGG